LATAGAGAASAAGAVAGMAMFLEEVGRRAAQEAEGTGGGVNLLTYHRAKGLEFDAVLLPALEEGLLPIRQATTPEEVAEERRLLYVGLTRARVHLWLSWAARRAGSSGREQSRKPSRFLDDLVPPGGSRVRPRAVATGMTRTGRASLRADGPLAEQLRAWRRKRAEADGVPAYVVFNDRTLAALTERRPRSRGELLAVEGIGPSKPHPGRGNLAAQGAAAAQLPHGTAEGTRAGCPAAGVPVLRDHRRHHRPRTAAGLDHPVGGPRLDLPVRVLHPLQPALHRVAAVRPGRHGVRHRQLNLELSVEPLPQLPGPR
jgi:hypothetical protein